MVDNAGSFAAGRAPKALSDPDPYDRLLGGFPQWLTAARTAGTITDQGAGGSNWGKPDRTSGEPVRFGKQPAGVSAAT
ncbi:VWA domain-containing protein [Streptomyces sp. NPDC087658]|uniref:VWA domain-containing protein n=2 Tax=unclassified Streptomyces TaxID=2593676 RepID=UPI003828943E